MTDSDVVPTLASVPLHDLNALAGCRAERRARKTLFRTGQLWSEVLYYQPGQSTPMHQHPFEEEQFLILSGRAAMNVGGEELVLAAGGLRWSRRCRMTCATSARGGW